MQTPAASPSDARTTVDLLLAAESTGGTCSAFELAGSAGSMMPPHRRDEHDLVLVVLAGAVDLRLDEAERRIEAGGVAWLPRGAACRVELAAESRLLCLVFPAGFENLAPGPGRAAPSADDVAVLLGLAGVSLLPVGWGRGRAEQ